MRVYGDCIFVGDVGRPDLLERAANIAGSMPIAARQLYRSIHRMPELPDYLQRWPGHGAGSACGKALGAMPQTTLGYEKLSNWAFASHAEPEFVDAVLAGQPEPPTYFAEMKRINRQGPAPLGPWRAPVQLDPARLPPALDAGAVVVDTRVAADFARMHVPGTINIPLNRSFSTWAAWLIPYDRAFYLIAEPDAALSATRDRAMIGLDNLAGFFDVRVVDVWRAAGGRVESVPQIGFAELRDRWERSEVEIVDVRGESEWEAGHVPGVRTIPVGYLRRRLRELPAGRPLVLQCQGGARSAIAASLLLAAGRRDVIDFGGGLAEWQRNGGPVERR